jgi:hypothetical protein
MSRLARSVASGFYTDRIDDLYRVVPSPRLELTHAQLAGACAAAERSKPSIQSLQPLRTADSRR